MKIDSQKSARIILFGDHRYRDVPALVLIAKHIRSLLPQADVRIISFDLWEQAISLSKPHLVVINHLHGVRNETIAKKVKQIGGKVVILPTEGRPNTDGQVEWAVNAWRANLCDLYLCWSDYMAERISKRVAVKVTGNPRFDFYHSELKKLLPSRSDVAGLLGIDPGKTTITVASSFPQAKFAHSRQSFNEQDWRDLKVTTIPGRENPTEFAFAEAEGLKTFRSWIIALRHSWPEAQIVVKPHPAEDRVSWEVFARDFDLTLMHNNYIWELLALSDLHIARGSCTTLCEAWAWGGIPTIACLIGNETSFSGPGLLASEWVDHRPDVLANFITSVASAKDVKDSVLEDRHNYLESWFGFSDNMSFSCLLSAAAIVKALPPVETLLATPTLDGLQQLDQVVLNHNAINSVPSQDHVGHFGKAVTLDSILEWQAKIDLI